MFIKSLVVGDVQTNCYIVSAYDSGECVVIDPGDYADYILSEVEKNGYAVAAILLTHGHFDHILAVSDIREKTGCKVYAYEGERELLKEPKLNVSVAHRMVVSETADVYCSEGDIINEAGFSFEVIATPGHTIGSVCYYVKDEAVLFSGDTLFEMSVGRTDLPTGSTSTLIRSIKEKLFKLPDNVEVYPGHGPATGIGFEKKNNMFV